MTFRGTCRGMPKRRWFLVMLREIFIETGANRKRMIFLLTGYQRRGNRIQGTFGDDLNACTIMHYRKVCEMYDSPAHLDSFPLLHENGASERRRRFSHLSRRGWFVVEGISQHSFQFASRVSPATSVNGNRSCEGMEEDRRIVGGRRTVWDWILLASPLVDGVVQPANVQRLRRKMMIV